MMYGKVIWYNRILLIPIAVILPASPGSLVCLTGLIGLSSTIVRPAKKSSSGLNNIDLTTTGIPWKSTVSN